LISSGKLTLLIPAARLFAGVDTPWPDKEGCTSYYSEREFHMKMLNRVDWGTRVVLFVGETSLLVAQEAQALVRHTKAYNLQLSKAAGVAEPYTAGESQMTAPIAVFLMPETKGRDT